MIPAHHEAVNMMAMLYVRNCMTRRCDRSPLFVILHQMVELELRRRLQAFTLLCGVCIATRQTRQSGVDPLQLLRDLVWSRNASNASPESLTGSTS